MLADTPLLIDLDLNPDLSSGEKAADFRRVMEANKHLIGVLDGNTRLDDAFDVVEAAGVDPMAYAGAVADAIEGVIRRGEILILE